MRDAYRLTVQQVRTTKQPGRYPDGGGLHLNVGKSGGRSWILIYRSPEIRIEKNGKRVGKPCEIGLGPVDGPDAVSLADARAKARELRAQIAAGTCPKAEADRKKKAKAEEAAAGGPMTVRKAFEAFFVDKEPTLKSKKHAALWRSTLETYAFPALGDRDVATVSTRDVADMLRPIWQDMPETAMRVQQRLKKVFDWAEVAEYRTASNPTLKVKSMLGERKAKVEHHRAIPYAEAPRLVATIRKGALEQQTRLALEWMILTVTRQSEARLAVWSEVDEAAALWTVPAERTKMKKQHVIPLPPRCLEILEEAKVFGRAGLIFPGVRMDRPLSENTLNMALKRLGFGDQTVAHGLRSTFKVWCATVAKVPDEISEVALSHVDRNKVRRAYLQTDFLDERRDVMERWARFLEGQEAATVIPFPVVAGRQ